MGGTPVSAIVILMGCTSVDASQRNFGVTGGLGSSATFYWLMSSQELVRAANWLRSSHELAEWGCGGRVGPYNATNSLEKRLRHLRFIS